MSDNKFKNAFSLLKSCLGNIRSPSNQIDNAEQTPSISPSLPVSLLCKVYEEKVEQFKATQASTASGIIELDRYMQEPLLDRHEDPLKWWHERKHTYPYLPTYICHQATLCVRN